MPADATGFVLAGGRSRRMGRDKALLPWAGTTLLDLAIARLRGCCREVVILCGPEPRYADRGVPIALDVPPGAGPLGAVMTGLSRLGGGPGVFLAVDLPNVPAGLLGHLVALVPGYDAAVPVPVQGPEPLCAVYTAACLGPIEDRIAAGELKMTSFWPSIRVREIPEGELARFGDPATLFRNLNDPSDLHTE
ncbi:MAG TPA: molybdenum cofactor guanylyltransferase [Vicinamibacteria bacterium]|nr:molybdenum cofactor guanylyltransferase [Vicinamibacteria bacterium]